MRISDWSSDVCSSDLLIAQVDPSVPVLFLETGKHFTETLDYRDALVSQLGLTNLVNITPDIPELSRKDETGLRWSYDPDGCCDIRTVKPRAKALAGFDDRFTGRTQFPSQTRASFHVSKSTPPPRTGATKTRRTLLE